MLLVLPLQEIFKPTHRQGSGHGDGVMRILDDAWCNRCCLTKHSEAPALDPSHAFKLSPCAALGFCYHEGEGLKAHRLHSNMAALLKPYLQAVRQKRKSSTDYVAPADLKKRKPIYPEARKALDSGFLVMRLAAGPLFAPSGDIEQETDSHSNWGSVAKRLLAITDEESPSRWQESHWLHVGYMNHSTRMFSVLQMDMLQENVPGDGRVKLSGLHDGQIKAFRSIEFFKEHLDFEQIWRVKLYKISSTSEMLGAREMMPRNVEARPYDEVPEFICWHGWSTERIRMPSAPSGSHGGGQGDQGQASSSSRGRQPAPRLQPQLVSERSVAGENPDIEQNLELLDRASQADEDAVDLPSDASVVDEGNAEELGQRRLDEVAADGADAPPPPAADPEGRAKAAPRRGGGRTGQEILRFTVPSGSIVWYAHSQDMTAFCSTPGHLECRKTRTARAGIRPGQGRPLGFLMAWLEKGHEHADQQAHVHRCRVTHQERRDGRLLLMQQDGWQEIANKERPQRGDEREEEPERFS